MAAERTSGESSSPKKVLSGLAGEGRGDASQQKAARRPMTNTSISELLGVGSWVVFTSSVRRVGLQWLPARERSHVLYQTQAVSRLRSSGASVNSCKDAICSQKM